MDYMTLFYWLVVADNARDLFLAFGIIFGIFALVATIIHLATGNLINLNTRVDYNTRHHKISRNWVRWSYPFMVLFWLLFVLTPSKRDSLLIIGGGQTLNYLVSDSTAKQIPHELTSFVVNELRSMAKEAKVELGALTEKDRIIEEAKSLTTDQLLEKMKIDDDFAKIILDKE